MKELLSYLRNNCTLSSFTVNPALKYANNHNNDFQLTLVRQTVEYDKVYKNNNLKDFSYKKYVSVDILAKGHKEICCILNDDNNQNFSNKNGYFIIVSEKGRNGPLIISIDMDEFVNLCSMRGLMNCEYNLNTSQAALNRA